jgi:hypothetical protein
MEELILNNLLLNIGDFFKTKRIALKLDSSFDICWKFPEVVQICGMLKNQP